jgi:ATP-dependent Zn protease
MKSSREATAYHEAGHAVAQYYLRLPIRKVTIVSDKEKGTLGHCESKGPLYLKGIDLDISPAKQDRIFRKIQALLAGNVAQQRFNKRSVRKWHASSDYRKAVDLAIRVTDTDGVRLLLGWLRHGTECLVQTRWREIEAIAAALLERKTLTGDEIREIINSLYGAIPHPKRR